PAAAPRTPCASIAVELDAQQLSADENVVAVAELALALQADVGAITAVEIREGELCADLFDAAVRRGHIEVARAAEIAPLAADLHGATARADHHAEKATLQNLADAERARVLRRGIEVRAILIGTIRGARGSVHPEELLAGEEHVSG